MHDNPDDDDLVRRGRGLLSKEGRPERRPDVALRSTEDVVLDLVQPDTFHYPGDITATVSNIAAAIDFLALSLGQRPSHGPHAAAQASLRAAGQLLVSEAQHLLSQVFAALGRPAVRARSDALQAFVQQNLWFLEENTVEPWHMQDRIATLEAWASRIDGEIVELQDWAGAQELTDIVGLAHRLAQAMSAWNRAVASYKSAVVVTEPHVEVNLRTRRTRGP